MSKKNTLLFGASLLTAVGAIAIDYATSEAPKPSLAQNESFNPCAAALPATPGQRSYDDLAGEYSGDSTPQTYESNDNASPCSAGAI